MPGKKKVAKMKRPVVKKVKIPSTKWAILGVVVVALAIPVTLGLMSESQDIRQQAAGTQIASTVITTMPNDTLKISISQENGNEQEDSSNGKGNSSDPGSGGNGDNTGGNGGNDQSGNGSGNSNCTTEDTTERNGGGTMRTININCNGQDQTDDQSGSDGNSQIINGGGQNGQISQPNGGGNGSKAAKDKNDKTGKASKKNKNKKNLIQQFVEFILGKQGRK